MANPAHLVYTLPFCTLTCRPFVLQGNFNYAEMDPIQRTSQLMQFYRRLEAATSRLEDMATSVDASHPETVAAITSAIAPQPEPTPTITEPAPQPVEPLPRTIEDFDTLIQEDVKAFVSASEKVGGLVEQQVCITYSER